MTVLPDFEHVRPTTLDEALAALNDDALPYHGGTELLAVMRVGLLRPRRLVDLKRVNELAGVRHEGGELVIGGGTTHRAVAADARVRAHGPLLAEVADLVGNVRVRASGTVAGNLCFAEPKSDLSTALLGLEATVTLRSAAGERRLTVDELLLGAYVADLQPGELLTEIRVPADLAATSAYRKFQTAERPTVGVAVLTGGRLDPRCRIVVGAVGERPTRVDLDDLDDVDAHALADGLDVIEDLSGAADYKRHVTAVTIRRAVDDLRRREAA